LRHAPTLAVQPRRLSGAAELFREIGAQPFKPAKEIEAAMKILLSITAALTLLSAVPSWACTPEEATAKREQLAKEVQKLTEQNPTKAKEINDELQKMDLETASKDLPDKCQLIDQRLKEMNTAEKKTE
jgi:hypothetical protein